ncbi:MAG: DnaJ domain-containing protein [Cyclobacteriaceae bacterium]|nr:DnaJ domain-containing protein [Cyclobacteriaceae bacterium]
MRIKNYYRILEVDPSSTGADIKKAYYRLAQRYHPDVSRVTDSNLKFQEINDAYRILSDPYSRAIYDNYNVYTENLSKESKSKEQFRPHRENYRQKDANYWKNIKLDKGRKKKYNRIVNKTIIGLFILLTTSIVNDLYQDYRYTEIRQNPELWVEIEAQYIETRIDSRIRDKKKEFMVRYSYLYIIESERFYTTSDQIFSSEEKAQQVVNDMQDIEQTKTIYYNHEMPNYTKFHKPNNRIANQDKQIFLIGSVILGLLIIMFFYF